MAAIADSSFRTAASSKNLARRLGLTGFGRWWVNELAEAMPARLRLALARRRARPVLAFDGDRATLWRPAANGGLHMKKMVRIALEGDERTVASAGRTALAPLVGASGERIPVVVTLGPRALLRKTITLPAALEDHLRQSLAYDVDRHTPFKADELYFDAVVVDRDPSRNALRVDLVAARRSIVDTVLRQAESFGARVVAIGVDPPDAVSTSGLNLLPEDRRPPATGFARWQFVVPLLLLVVGAIAALLLPIWQKREEVIALIAQAEQARQRAAVSDALRTAVERSASDYNFALERKYAFPGAVQVLEDVSRILPDDTWLTQFELHTLRGKDAQREITLRGESANAGRLVAMLEDSKIFTQAAPRSPTTKIQPGPGEIFDVGAHLAPQPAPAPLPLDMTAPAPRKPAVAQRPANAAAATSPTMPAASATETDQRPTSGEGAPATAPGTTRTPATRSAAKAPVSSRAARVQASSPATGSAPAGIAAPPPAPANASVSPPAAEPGDAAAEPPSAAEPETAPAKEGEESGG